MVATYCFLSKSESAAAVRVVDFAVAHFDFMLTAACLGRWGKHRRGFMVILVFIAIAFAS